MKVDQIYTSCIAEAAYYIESNGEAAVIDPLRDPEPYINKAESDKATIKYIFETHFHADFVSGHLDLAKRTGAKIVYGPMAMAAFDIVVARDNQEFQVGNAKIRVLHTPGHTMESSTLMLIDEEGKEKAIFTGDTLLLGDVGRPDLAVKTNLTKEELASYLFDSLRNKIVPLADDLIVYPGHGAGSACGKHLAEETVDTLGNQKKINYGLRADMSREEFISEVLEGQLPPPAYFPKNALMNKQGYESIDDVMHRGNIPLTVEEFEEKINTGALVLDVRSKNEYAESHIPGSLFIGLDGNFAMWVGALINDINCEILLVVSEERAAEAISRLARVGYDHAIGYLSGGVETWQAEGRVVEKVDSLTAEDLAAAIRTNQIAILDVRKHSEFDNGHLEKARHFPLDYIHEHLDELDRDQTYYVHCKGGYRSLAAISILKKAGYKKLINVSGGMDAIQKTNIPLVGAVCEPE